MSLVFFQRQGTYLKNDIRSVLLFLKMATPTTASFPNEISRSVKLQIPKEWNSKSSWCHLEYDATRNLLLVISCDGNILDVIDPDDMIGSSLSLEPKDENGLEVVVEKDPVVRDTRIDSFVSRASNEPETDELLDRKGIATLTLYCYPRLNPSKHSWGSWLGLSTFQPRPDPHYIRNGDVNPKWERYAHFRSFTLWPVEDFKQVNLLLTALQTLAIPNHHQNNNDTATKNKSLRYLVVVNPFSGPKRNAAVICETLVQPMLEQSGITTVDVFITQHAKHAQQRMAKIINSPDDMANYQGLVLMGGDGIIFEVINGLLQRPDIQEIRHSLTLGVVGCGTGNGFAASVAYAAKEPYGNLTDVFLICKRKSFWSDISQFQIQTPPNDTIQKYHSFLTLSYGMIADIDIESEFVRWLGALRIDLWAVWRTLFLRKYPAQLAFLPPQNDPDPQKTSHQPISWKDPPPANWKIIQDDIILFWSSQVSHAAFNVQQAPTSQFNDGLFKLFLVRGNVSRLRMALILLSMETGQHVNLPHVEMIDCCAFRLTPDQNKMGRNVLDGELVEPGPIQAQVLPSFFQFFGKP